MFISRRLSRDYLMTKRRSRVQTGRGKIQRNQSRTQQYEDEPKLAVTQPELDFCASLFVLICLNCEPTPSSRKSPQKDGKRAAVPVSSRGLGQRRRFSKRHKGTPSFFSQPARNCCESHVLSDGTSRPSPSRTVPAHQN